MQVFRKDHWTFTLPAFAEIGDSHITSALTQCQSLGLCIRSLLMLRSKHDYSISLDIVGRASSLIGFLMVASMKVRGGILRLRICKSDVLWWGSLCAKTSGGATTSERSCTGPSSPRFNIETLQKDSPLHRKDQFNCH